MSKIRAIRAIAAVLGLRDARRPLVDVEARVRRELDGDAELERELDEVEVDAVVVPGALDRLGFGDERRHRVAGARRQRHLREQRRLGRRARRCDTSGVLWPCLRLCLRLVLRRQVAFARHRHRGGRDDRRCGEDDGGGEGDPCP